MRVCRRPRSCRPASSSSFNYAGNTLTNQHSDINGTHDLLQDESLCEFIVTSEVFMTDSAKYSDIIIPDLTLQEQYSLSANGYADNMEAIVYGSPVYEPKFERRGIYEVCTDIADRLGIKDEFTDGGKTREDWLRRFSTSRARSTPSCPIGILDGARRMEAYPRADDQPQGVH